MNILIFSCLLVGILTCCHGNIEEDYDITHQENEYTKVLSRRKRFLIFPDGSSFQLVFCTENQGYLQIGNVVWFGNTAGLAWELPSDPALFNMFKGKLKEPYIRRKDEKHILYADEMGRVIAKVPYKKRLIVNPAFAKRSVDFVTSRSISVKEMHASNKGANLDELNENSIEFHRRGRKSLYVKIEKVFEAMGWNGRQCVLRLLCETRKKKSKQGTFLEEIMRATFTESDTRESHTASSETSFICFSPEVNQVQCGDAIYRGIRELIFELPKGREFEGYYKEYDVAHGSDGDCGQLYPECEDERGQRLFDNV